MAFRESGPDEVVGFNFLAYYHNMIISRSFLKETTASVILNAGCFAGRKGHITPIRGNHRICEDCGCVAGGRSGACFRIPEGLIVEEDRLLCPTCHHNFCQHCHMPATVPPFCAICRQLSVLPQRSGLEMWTARGRKIRTRLIAQLGVAACPTIPVWERTGAILIQSFPFVYEPMTIGTERRESDIVPEAAAEMRRDDLWLHVARRSDSERRVVYLTVDRQGSLAFDHYHRGCWGNVEWPTEWTPEIIAHHAHDMLTHINAASPARQRPSGFRYSVHSIPHGPPREVKPWSLQREIARTEQERLVADILSRQQGVGLEVPRKVMVVGCGGVGWHIATMAALVGVGKLALVDHDTIDRSNMSRLVTNSTGRGKATVLESILSLQTWRSMVGDQDYAIGFFSDKFSEFFVETQTPDVIIDSTDDVTTQREIYRMAKKYGARYIRAGYDGGWHVTVSSRPAPTWSTGELGPGYAVPAWIGGAVFVASMALVKLCYRPDLEISADLRDMLSMFHEPGLVTMPIEEGLV